jgi:hypothetical protein
MLLRRVFGLEIPTDADPGFADGSINLLVATEARTDLVLRLMVPGSDKPELAIIVEVQLSPDEDKPFTWPLYQIALRARERCAVVVLVVALDASVARWAGRRHALGGGPSWWPLVLGPKEVPPVPSLELARTSPELAVLSVLAHGRGEAAVELVFGVLEGLGRLAREGALDDEHARVYHDLILASVSQAAKEKLEAMFDIEKYGYQSDFAKKHFARGIEQGLEQGLGTGLVVALRARGFATTSELEARIHASPRSRIEAWLGRVLSARSLEEVFRDAD